MEAALGDRRRHRRDHQIVRGFPVRRPAAGPRGGTQRKPLRQHQRVDFLGIGRRWIMPGNRQALLTLGHREAERRILPFVRRDARSSQRSRGVSKGGGDTAIANAPGARRPQNPVAPRLPSSYHRLTILPRRAR